MRMISLNCQHIRLQDTFPVTDATHQHIYVTSTVGRLVINICSTNIIYTQANAHL
jgi:hypothetical protein